MDSLVDMIFLRHFFINSFLESVKQTGDGYMKLSPKRAYAKGSGLIRPAGKKIVVSTTNLIYRQPLEYIAKDQPEYFYISLCRGTMRGIAGSHIKKENVYQQHCKAGFSHSGIGLSFLPDFLDRILESHHDIAPDELERTFSSLHNLPLIPDAAVILNQIGEASFNGNVSNLWIEAKALELVSIVLEWHRRRTREAQPCLKENDQAGIAEAIRYVEEHFSEPVTLEVLAKEAAMSISKFTAAFKLHTGIPAACYVRRFRMDKAMYLLKNTQSSLGEIAEMVGCKHQSKFFTLFREQFGVTPGKLRKGNDKG